MAEEVHDIGFEDLGRFGIGASSGQLYYGGEKVHTESKVRLTGRQTWFALSVGVFTILGAVGGVAYDSVYIWDTLRYKPQRQVGFSFLPREDHTESIRFPPVEDIPILRKK